MQGYKLWLSVLLFVPIMAILGGKSVAAYQELTYKAKVLRSQAEQLKEEMEYLLQGEDPEELIEEPELEENELEEILQGLGENELEEILQGLEENELEEMLQGLEENELEEILQGLEENELEKMLQGLEEKELEEILQEIKGIAEKVDE